MADKGSARDDSGHKVVELPTMAYVVARHDERWDLRESSSTPAGPRSRTLASFRALTPEILEHAGSRSSKPLDERAIRDAARRAGAPVIARNVDHAAAALLAEIAAGRAPRGPLRDLLIDALEPDQASVSDSVRAAARWAAATTGQRGETLRDLLALADRLPPARRSGLQRFPRIASRPA
jgi:hypothetical protein